jgi:hypothetical protein
MALCGLRLYISMFGRKRGWYGCGSFYVSISAMAMPKLQKGYLNEGRQGSSSFCKRGSGVAGSSGGWWGSHRCRGS